MKVPAQQFSLAYSSKAIRAFSILLAILLTVAEPLLFQAQAAAIVLQMEQKLRPADLTPLDRFGISAALSDRTALIGACYDYCDDETGIHTGSAYIFVQSVNGGWTQQVKLKGADTLTDDAFGCSAALSGGTALIGAYGDDHYKGSAYVFVRSADGAWTQQAKLMAADSAKGNRFGSSVALSGSTALIGAGAYRGMEGSAYVFVRSADGAWTQQAKLMAADGAKDSRFGSSVALSGGTALIGTGAYRGMEGSAYVFVRSADGAWTQQAKLMAADGAKDSRFGSSVAVDDGVAVVSAIDGDDMVKRSGSVYVFVQSGISWHQQVKLTAEDRTQRDRFGSSVTVDGGLVLVGASAAGRKYPSSSAGEGAAYMHSISGW